MKQQQQRLCSAVHHTVSFELLKNIRTGRTRWNEIMSFKGFFAEGPTEAIIAKKTRGALETAVRSLRNILLNTQEEPHWSGNKEPNLVAVWLTRQTVTLLMMNSGGRQRKPVLGFHTVSLMSATDTVVNHLELICWWFCTIFNWIHTCLSISSLGKGGV